MLSILGALPKEEQIERFKKSPQFNPETQKFQNRRHQWVEEKRKEAMSLSTALEWLKAGDSRVPKKPLPQNGALLIHFLLEGSVC